MLARLCLIALASVLLSARDKETALGSQLAGQIRKSTTALGDAAVEDYIQELGSRFANQPRGRDWQWQFAVIRDDVGGSTHEPLSIPGGHIFVPAPLILAAGSEAELAGMLAHSMAHVIRRDAIKGGNGAPLIFMGSWMGDRTVLPVAFVEEQRANELDADRVAVDMMAVTGYDPSALLAYVARRQETFKADAAPQAGLPEREERISALKAAVTNARFSSSQPAGDLHDIQDKVRELIEASKRPGPTLRRSGGQ